MKTVLLPFAVITVASLALTDISDPDISGLLDKALDFGLTGLLLFFGSQHLIRALDNVVAKVGVLRESVNDLKVEVSRLEVMIDNLACSNFGRPPHFHKKDD